MFFGDVMSFPNDHKIQTDCSCNCMFVQDWSCKHDASLPRMPPPPGHRT